MATSNDTPPTVKIQLTKGYIAIIDAQDVDLVAYLWHAHIGQSGRVYARRSVYKPKRHYEYLHNVIYYRVNKQDISPQFIIDHIDNDPLNNRRSNLREVTFSQNLYNSKKRDKTQLKGAHFNKRDKRWTSTITTNGKIIWLGSFSTPEEAHAAYCEASKKYHGEFGRTE